MKPGIRYLLLGVLLIAVGCAHQPSSSLPEYSRESTLQPWVENELAPYLAEQLSSHPRFRGEPVILVKLEGPDIQPEIDGLTRAIRLQVRGALLNTAGVTLPWRPRQREQRHHRRLDRVNCHNIHEANYYIGIEITETIGGRFGVSVRALDVQAREWVSGFGKSWRGGLTAREHRALEQLQPDEAVRGLRVLPFEPGQTDLAADYLANNLSCLLRQTQEEELVVYVETPGREPPFLAGTLKLIGNNLSRYREVRVSEKKREAGFILRGDAHELSSGLHQIWVRLSPKRSGIHLSGLDTATYLRSGGAAPVARAAEPLAQEPVSVHRVRPRIRTARPHISRMELAAASARDCPAPGGGLPRHCRVLNLEVEDLDHLFVIAHSPKQGLTRLLPGRCSGETGPSAGARQAVRLNGDGSPGTTFYAIAVNGHDLTQRFARHLERLPDRCASAGESGLPTDGLDRWLNQLDQMIAANRERVSWAAQRAR